MHVNVEFNLNENIWSGWRVVRNERKVKGRGRGGGRWYIRTEWLRFHCFSPVLLPPDLLQSPLSSMAGGSTAGVNYLALIHNPQLLKLVTHQRCHGRNWSFWWIPVGNNLWCMDISFWYSFWNWRSVEAFQTVLTYTIRSASVIEVNSFRTRQQFWIWPPMQ